MHQRILAKFSMWLTMQRKSVNDQNALALVIGANLYKLYVALYYN